MERGESEARWVRWRDVLLRAAAALIAVAVIASCGDPSPGAPPGRRSAARGDLSAGSPPGTPTDPTARDAVVTALREFLADEHDAEGRQRLDDAAGGIAAEVGAVDSDLPDLITEFSFSFASPRDVPRQRQLVAGLESAGPDGPKQLLEILIEQLGQPRAVEVSIRWDSQEENVLAAFLRDHADPALDARLIEVLGTRTYPFDLRELATVALCRSGNRAALDALLAVAMNQTEDVNLREAVLVRLHLLDVPAPAALRDLLYVPFCSPVEQVAAAALARMGDPEAPSLVVATLRPRGGAALSHDYEYFAAAAAQVIGSDDPELLAAVRAVRARPAWVRGGDGLLESLQKEHRKSIDQLVERLSAHVESRPDLCDTGFERRRVTDRARAAQMAASCPQTIDEILATPEEDLDLAAALFVVERGAPPSAQSLERLGRLVGLLDRRRQPDQTPEAQIQVLTQRLLLARGQMRVATFVTVRPPGAAAEWGFQRIPQDLATALEIGPTLCVSRTSLLLVVADRLSLPIHAVSSPGHVFARWDDGTFRRNIECTNRGIERPDENYVNSDPGHAIADLAVRDPASRGGAGVPTVRRAREKPRFLRNLTKREYLAIVAANRAAALTRSGHYAAAIELAEQALRLDSRCTLAHRVIAWSASGLETPAAGERVVVATRAARESGAISATEARILAESLVRARRPDLARELCDDFLAEVPDNEVVLEARSRLPGGEGDDGG